MSLRTRLTLGICGVMLPFLGAAAVGALYLLPALLAPLKQVVAEVTDELEPVHHLQVSLLTAALSAHALGRGEASGEYVALTKRVELDFESVRNAPFFNPAERSAIDAAWKEWGRAQALSRTDALPGGAQARARALAVHAENAAAILDSVDVPVHRELEAAQAKARAAERRSLSVTFAAFVAALLLSAYAAARLAGLLVSDVERLRAGALRLARGELSHRVEALRGLELNDLAIAFNGMAERIEKDQSALATLARTDGLTGLANRREFLARLREELDRSRRYAHPCALLMLDVDNFKSVNDTWGHPAGDEVLRAVAARIGNEIRPTDRAARYGGEEFAVLLPETDAAGAMSVAERVRAAIAATPVVISTESAIGVRVSVGVAACAAGGMDDRVLLSSADEALYAAKQGGRNRVVAAG